MTTAFREGALHVPRGALLLSAALTVITVPVLAPVMPVLKAAFADEVEVDLWVRLLVTSPALFIALTAPVAGRLADRIGHHRVLAISLALYGVAGASALVVDGRWHLLLGRALLGVAASGVMIASSAIAGARYDAGERARFFAQQAGVMSLAGIAAVSLGGLLGTQHWRAPCLVYLLALPLLIVVVSNGVAVPLAARWDPPTRLAGASSAWACALALVGMSFVFMVPLQMPFVLSGAGNPPSVAGLAIALCGAFTAASAFFLGRFGSLSSASDAFVWIARSFAVMGSGYVALGLSHGMTPMLAALAVAGIGSGWLMPSLAQWVVSASPEHTRAASLGALTSCVYAGQFASPWLSQLIGAGHSIGFSFTSAGVALFLLAAALVVLSASARMRRTGPRPGTARPARIEGRLNASTVRYIEYSMGSLTTSSDLWDALAEFRTRVVDEMQGGVASLAIDLSMPQAMVLTAIFDEAPITVSALQQRIRRSQATTSHLVTQLELRGLVERGGDPSDARRTVVKPSREGRRLMVRLEKQRKQSFERVLGRLPAPVRSQLEKALRATLDALEESR